MRRCLMQCFVALLLFTFFTPTNADSATEARNKAVVRTLIEEVINKSRYDLIDRYLATGVTENDPHQAQAESPHAAFRRAVEASKQAFPDGETVIEAQLAEDDYVVTRWRFSGTHQGDFRGIAPTGRKVEMTGIFFDRLENGKLIETWANYDLYGLMRQLEAAPGNH